ncbi:MAG: imelysin family protein [Flavobacteriales bacterium]
MTGKECWKITGIISSYLLIKIIIPLPDWQRVSIFNFGPAKSLALRKVTNTYPVDSSGMEEKIDTGNTDISGFANLDKKGFPAIDYLLYSKEPDSALINLYTDSANKADRKTYLKKVSKELSEKSTKVLDKWIASNGNYIKTFVSNTGTDEGSSLSLIVNSLNQHFETWHRKGKFGIPLGKETFSDDKLPEKSEAFFSKISLSLAKKNLKTMKHFYLGKGEDGDKLGLDNELRFLETKHNDRLLADAILDQFTKAQSTMDQIPTPLTKSLTSNTSIVNDTYDNLQQMIVLLKTDMPSALGVLITYQDNDND